MKIAFLDTISGIAGDMTLSAFVSAGLPIDELSSELTRLPISGFELVGSHVTRSSIAAVHIDVVVSADPQPRHLRHILDLLDSSSLSEGVRENSRRIFRTIAEAEARVHNTAVDQIHFHEVGGIDSIVDVVGTAICLEKFGIERVYSSPVRLGSGGTIETAHGTMPIPTPATLEILKGYPSVLTDIPYELTTPTGAAIVKALSAGILSEDVIHPEAIGYGAGTRIIPQLPNLLRVVVGQLQSDMDSDETIVIETNIDDMNPQLYPFLIERLMQEGALDAYLVPVIMKKGRPGILLSILARRPAVDRLLPIVYQETSTIGVRMHPVRRRKLPRRELTVQTQFGPVRAKEVIREGKEIVTAEFEECRRIAEERGIPLRDVLAILERELGIRNIGRQ